MLYLGLPYSHPDPVVRDQRARQGELACIYFFKIGVPVYCPIVHWHDTAIRFHLPTDAGPWKTQNYGILTRSTQMGILKLEGWRESKGLAGEIEVALEARVPIKLYKLLTPERLICEGLYEV